MDTLLNPNPEAFNPLSGGPDKGVYTAQLAQQDPTSGLRGWKVYVVLPGRVDLWPERVWSRQAAGRPPKPADRLQALAELGFEPIKEAEYPEWLWQWEESTDLNGNPQLFATVAVRRIGAQS